MEEVLEHKLRDKRTAVRRSLLAWYRREKRDLPWRGTTDPYRVWLSEIMLQQTRVETVVGYYGRFLDAFPSVRSLARAPEDRVLKLWEGLGYYSRARNLHRAAKEIVRERGGRLPERAEQWRKLPGVGRYTAGAIASIAFGERAAVLDGNVKRVLARLFEIDSVIDSGGTQTDLWSLSEGLVPPGSPGDFNQALMELGARICTPRNPDCGGCPLRRRCDALSSGRQAQLPVKRARMPVPHRHVVAAAIQNRQGRFLLGKRPPGGMLAGLWEFPGGKVEPGESRPRALAREIREELGMRVRIGRHIASVDHAYTHLSVTLHLYACRIAAGRPRARYHSRIAWVSREHFSRYALPGANHKLIAKLQGAAP